ncbi:hypothetical protein N9L06_04410 [Mariniblastus sp.]|nr:hypothetical protein [Mariniblastus sp.]
MMPRLTIWHLLIWTAVSSCVAARISVPFSIPLALNVAITGGAITASVIVIYSCFKHKLWSKTEPGHWFAFVAAWQYIDMIAFTPTCVSLLPIEDGYVYCLTFVGMAVIYALGSIVGRWEWYWRLALLLHGIDNMLAVAWRLMNEQGNMAATNLIQTQLLPVIGCVAVLFVVIAIALDVYRKRYRDWPHWVGIVYFLFHWYGLIVAYVIPHYFPPQPVGDPFA